MNPDQRTAAATAILAAFVQGKSPSDYIGDNQKIFREQAAQAAWELVDALKDAKAKGESAGFA
jgi:hypothetical protein